MIVLGIHIETTSTAALMVDDKIVACASEERFSRLKNDERYPRQAIDYCLRQAGIQGKDIDVVAIGSEQLLFSTWATRVYSTFSIEDHIRAQRQYWYPHLYGNERPLWVDVFKDKLDLDQFPGSFSELMKLDTSYFGENVWPRLRADIHDGIARHLLIDKNRICHVEHHTAHAAYAYWSSPFRHEDVLVLTADAWGDGLSATINVAHEDTIVRLKGIPANEFRLARLYRYITLLLGMKPNEHEYKVMGMAPYAKEPTMRRPYQVFKDTMYVDGTDFRWKDIPADMYFYFRDKLEGCRFDGIAGALQKYTEEILSTWVGNAIRDTGIRKVVLAGGISMNIKANQIIGALPNVDSFFVGGSGSDESLALGCCYHVMSEHYQERNRDRRDWPQLSLALGPRYTSNEVRQWAIDRTLADRYHVEFNVTAGRVAELLAGGHILGRMAGPMEFGARALGNRSIIADPRQRSTIEKLNEKIKSRDFWMPFAPSIIEEACERYVVNPKGLWSPFMTIGFDSTPLARQDIPAALHPADHTMRPQMVRKSDNPDYHALISAFEVRTGVGALLNTSFNLHGLPIVNGPDDACHVFENSELDVMLLEDTLIRKRSS